jgi:5-methylcytosine-specific restriction endonuclease McrA
MIKSSRLLITAEMKTCTKCSQEKPLTEYHKQKLGRFGVRAICIDCAKKYVADNRDSSRAYQKQYEEKNKEKRRLARHEKYLANKEKVALQAKAWREANAERVSETRRQHYQRNKDRVSAENAARRLNNPERAKQAALKYREKNREKLAEYHKNRYLERKHLYAEMGARWYAENKDRKNKSASEWKKSNLDKIREYNNRRRAMRIAAGDDCTAEEATAILEAQRYICANILCGADLTKVKKHLDHKTPLVRGGGNGANNLQWLCQKCNLSKGRLTNEEWQAKLQMVFAEAVAA